MILANDGDSVLHLAAWKPTDNKMMKFLLNYVMEARKLVDMEEMRIFEGLWRLHPASLLQFERQSEPHCTVTNCRNATPG